VVQKGYMQCRQEYYNESSAVIPKAMHIEHVPQLATFDCVWDACRQAEKDGIIFINDMEGLEKGFYVDTPENRKICADGLKQYPNLRIENWIDIEDGEWGSGYAEYFLKEEFAQTDEMAVKPEQLTRRLNVTVMCQAVYNSGIDVPVDLPFEQALAYAKEHHLPVVVATTGLTADQIQSVKDASSDVPVFFSANMSLGISLLAELAKKAAALLGEDFDVEIVEKHHNQKIDAPSGTALMLAHAVEEGLDYEPTYVYDRQSVRQKRDRHEIGFSAVRGGNIVGEHEVLFAGHDEIVTLSHSARSKEVFAVGAVNAALFMVGKPAGLYTMADLVK